MFACLRLMIVAAAPVLGLAINAANADDQGAVWTSSGCYIDSIASRSLAQASWSDPTGLTVDSCLDYCTKEGYPYAGLEFAQECYCGLLNLSPGQANDTDCYQTCTGNPSQICGGPNRISVYSRQIPEPQVNPGVNGWSSLGCYSDSLSDRLLRYYAIVPGGATNVSVATCTTACSVAGYSLAGVEYGGECWCDNPSIANYAPAENCDMPCRGNLGEFCGGSLAANLYKFGVALSTQLPDIPVTTTSIPSMVDAPPAVSTPAVSNPSASTPEMQTQTLVVVGSPIRFNGPKLSTPTPPASTFGAPAMSVLPPTMAPVQPVLPIVSSDAPNASPVPSVVPVLTVAPPPATATNTFGDPAMSVLPPTMAPVQSVLPIVSSDSPNATPSPSVAFGAPAKPAMPPTMAPAPASDSPTATPVPSVVPVLTVAPPLATATVIYNITTGVMSLPASTTTVVVTTGVMTSTDSGSSSTVNAPVASAIAPSAVAATSASVSYRGPSPTNVIKNPQFGAADFVWNTVTNPMYGDYSNLVGNVASTDDGLVSAYILSSKQVRSSSWRSYCLQQSVTVPYPGTYQFRVAVGRQILNGTGKPIPSLDRLQFNIYYDSNQLNTGNVDVCNPEYVECDYQGPFGGFDLVTSNVQVPYRGVGQHQVAVCGVFGSDATFGLDSIVFYSASLTGPTKGGR